MGDPILLGLLTSIAGIWLGSVEIRMRNLDNKLRDIPSRKEVNENIDIRLESVRVLQQEIKEDIKELKVYIEKLASRS